MIFVNSIWTEPFFISRIEDKYGNLIQNFIPTKQEALSEETAYLMLHMLKGSKEEEGGTARGLNPELTFNNDVGAKTGTTQNASEAFSKKTFIYFLLEKKLSITRFLCLQFYK